MIDVYISVFADRGYRQGKVLDHFGKLAREYQANLTILVPDLLPPEEAPVIMERIAPYPLYVMKGPRSQFQRNRRIAAERLSKTKIYLLCDDDCTFDNDEAIPYALTAMLDPAHESFAVAAPLPSNANIVAWRPENYSPLTTEQITEHVSVGGLRFCRKGALPEDESLWTPQPPETHAGFKYDTEHGVMLRDRGLRSGFFRHLQMTHWGEKRPKANSMLVH